MPVIQIDMTPVTTEMKREIIKEVTETLINITKAPKEAFTVIIRENSLDSMGNSGISIADAQKK